MKNGINRIRSVSKMEAIIEKLRKDNFFIVEINGLEIDSFDSFLDDIETGFKIPFTLNRDKCKYEIDDKKYVHIGDLYKLFWIDSDGFAIVIYNHRKLQKRLQNDYHLIIENFEFLSVVWWSEDHSDHRNFLPRHYHRYTDDDGYVYTKAKPFYIYLVD